MPTAISASFSKGPGGYHLFRRASLKFTDAGRRKILEAGPTPFRKFPHPALPHSPRLSPPALCVEVVKSLFSIIKEFRSAGGTTCGRSPLPYKFPSGEGLQNTDASWELPGTPRNTPEHPPLRPRNYLEIDVFAEGSIFEKVRK